MPQPIAVDLATGNFCPLRTGVALGWPFELREVGVKLGVSHRPF